MPDDVSIGRSNTMNDVKEQDMDRESIRSEMWWELASKSIFEGMFEPRKKQIQVCINHKGYSKEFEKHVWKHTSTHKRGYRKTRIPYLFDG